MVLKPMRVIRVDLSNEIREQGYLGREFRATFSAVHVKCGRARVVSSRNRFNIISPSMLAELTMSEDLRPPKEFFLGMGELFEPNPWDCSDDSDDGHLLAASQMHELSMGTPADVSNHWSWAARCLFRPTIALDCRPFRSDLRRCSMRAQGTRQGERSCYASYELFWCKQLHC